MTCKEPVAEIARALKRTMEPRVKRLNLIGLSLKLAPQNALPQRTAEAKQVAEPPTS